MKKFNNTLEGTDCGDAGLPSHTRDIAKTQSVLRIVPKMPDIESMMPRTTAPNACDQGRNVTSQFLERLAVQEERQLSKLPTLAGRRSP
jgi:hypothetical protein